jgi:Suppressor of fused protein (SUFU)
MGDPDVLEAIADAYAAHLGTPEERRHVTERLHVLRYRTGEHSDVATYVTLGLAELVVRQETGDVRQELLFECHQRFASDAWVSVLTFVAGRVAIDGAAVPAFEVVALDTALRKVTGVAALLCFTPIYHSSSLHVIEGTDPPTVVVWLVPLHETEAALARRDGWESLVSILEQRQPDLLDLKRRPIA